MEDATNEIVDDQTPQMKVVMNNQYYIDRIRELGWSRDELKIIYSKLPQGVPLEEAYAFLCRAKALGLDPMSGQIILQSHTNGKTGEVRYTVIVGIDGYRSMAIRTGVYAPGDDTVFKYKEDGTILSATVYVKRYHPESNQWNQFSGTAMYDEYCVFFYDRNTRERKPTQMWEKMGHTMLEKCAEAKALRRGFPETLAGLYTAEELAQTASASVEAEESAKRGARLNERTVKALGEKQ